MSLEVMTDINPNPPDLTGNYAEQMRAPKRAKLHPKIEAKRRELSTLQTRRK